MKVPRHVLAQAIAERTLTVRDTKLLAREIAAYLLAERRVRDLEPIIRDVMQYRAQKGMLEAEIVHAHDVNDAVVKDVRQLLRHAYPTAESVHVNTRRDESVVGGLRIDMPNEQLDLSLADKLATFKRITSEKGL